ncbi:DUF1778 domain-containing protein [Parapusillimonas sp. SGNA-6]|nr:DUF1778 domain-containing protein [Parapusillimonas sp. SGNA-6]
MTTILPPSKRLEARISPDLHAMLKQAAALEGRTVTDFVIDAVQAAARGSIERAQVVRLSLADQQAFANALISPPSPNKALKQAFEKRKTLLNSVDE